MYFGRQRTEGQRNGRNESGGSGQCWEFVYKRAKADQIGTLCWQRILDEISLALREKRFTRAGSVYSHHQRVRNITKGPKCHDLRYGYSDAEKRAFQY